MKRPAQTKTRPRAFAWPAPASPPVAVVFFALFLLYVGLRIEPSLEPYKAAHPFFVSHAFFRPFLTYPGGLADYVAAFFGVFNYHNWLGALLYTVMGCLAFLVTRAFLKRASGITPQLASYGPPFLLLFLRDRYDFPALAAGAGWLLAMGAALGFAAWPRRQSWCLLVVCWIFSALLFYVAGLWSCLLFVVLASGSEFRQQRAWRLTLGFVLAVLVAPLWILCFPETDLSKLLNPWGERWLLILATAFYLFTPLAAGVLTLVRSPTAPAEDAPRVRHRAASAGPARRWFQTDGVKRSLATGFFLFGWVGIWLALDLPHKARLAIDYYSDRGEHEKVLAIASGLKSMGPVAEIRLHRSLYHTGRLGQDLFSFTHQTAWELLPALEHGLDACRAQSETLLELGQVNMAEHFAHEALEHEGDHPEILRLLARINILKDRPQAARIFLNVLRQIPFHRESAERCLRDLEADPRLADDDELNRIRSRMVATDLPHSDVPTEAALLQLLQTNRRNRMAFEYLMSHYLLTRQPEKLVEELGRLDDFGYADLPRHYQEAVLLHQQRRGGATVDLRGRRMDPETVQRFQQLSEALRRRVPESAAGREAMARDFGDTFWYYFFTRRSDTTGNRAVYSTESS